MTATPLSQPAARNVLGVEKHGFDFIPLRERTMTLPGAALFWAGTQANLLPMTLGAIAVTLGLGLGPSLIAIVMGTSLFAFVAASCVAGPRAGVPTLTFSRAAFGIKGNLPNVALTWVSLVAFECLNTILAALAILAFLPIIGIPDPGFAGQIIAIVIMVAVGAIIATLGHSVMVWVQRAASVVLVIAVVLVLASVVSGADWSNSVSMPPAQLIGTLTIAAAANASGPISYLFNSPEWFRYLPRDVSAKKLFWTLFPVGFGVSTLLGFLGAVLASQVDMSDPIGAPAALMPTPVYLAFLLAAILGTLSNNIPTLYSSGLTLQALGLPISRMLGTIVDSVIATVVTLVVVVNGGFLDVLEIFASLLIVWLLPFGATYVADAVARRWIYDPIDLHDLSRTGQYSGVNVHGIVALLIGMAVALLAIDSPVFVGPVSAALGADLSWFLPLPVSFGVYLLLAWRHRRSPAALILAERALERQTTVNGTEHDAIEREQTTAQL